VKTRHKVLGMLFLVSIITYLDRIALAAALPQISNELGLLAGQMGLVASVFVLGYGLFEIPGGWMGDRFGPRRILTRIVVWWSLFTAATGAVRSYWSLLACRFLFGAGEAGFYPNSSCTIARWFPFAERARAQGIVWTASRVGAALALLTVPALQAAIGWRAVFYVFGVVGSLWAVAWFLWFRDWPQEKAGVSSAELAEIGESAPGRHVSLPWRTALASKNLWAVMLMYHTYCYGSYWFFSLMPTYLKEAKGIAGVGGFSTYGALPYVLGALANFAGGSASQWMVGRVGLKWGRRLIGAVSMAAAGVLMLLSMLFENRAAALVVLAFSFAVSDFMLPNCWAVCLDIGKRYAGTVTGAMNMAGQFGATIGAAVYGSMVQKLGWSHPVPMIGLATLSLVSALIWLIIDPTEALVPEGKPALGAAPALIPERSAPTS
jgi:ACS family glucarate transporter-like MFS transporter